MKKGIRILTAVCAALSAVVLTLVGLTMYLVPDQISLGSDTPSGGGIALFSSDPKNLNGGGSEAYNVDIRLFNVIPVKSAHVSVSQREYVAVGGNVFGIRLYTDGVIVVKTDSVETADGTVNPSKAAGLKTGDAIRKINGQTVCRNEEVAQILASSGGAAVDMEVVRGETVFHVDFKTALSSTDGKYRAGLWVRDSTAGIGTMTFYDPDTGIFGGLGHAVCDVDTGELMPLSDGDIVEAKITGCYKGSSGSPGELCGTFNSDAIGDLLANGVTGVYGRLYQPDTSVKTVPVALSREVQTGPAQILATIDGTEPQYYDVEIKRTYSNDSGEQKNMVIEVTDSELIEKTGGIVQGMSGCPIIQNGMFVGAVTHVLLNDPLQGYAIYAENMLKTADSIASNTQSDAA